MKKMFKTSIISLFILAAATGIAAQPSPPHEIYGDVKDQGTATQDITVDAVTDSNTYSDSTDSNGYYEIKVPSSESSFDIVVDGSTVETGITVQSGSIANYDFSGDYIEDGGSSDDPDCGDEEEYDSDEGECVPVEEEEPVEQPEEDEDQQDQEREDEQQEEEEESQEPVNETVEVQAEVDENNKSSASVNASAGQTVKVNLQQEKDQGEGEIGQDGSGESQESEDDGVSVSSVSATASSDTSVSVSVSEVSEGDVEEPLEDQIDYQNIEVDGEVSSQTIEFSVSKSRLDERGAGPDQVVKERYSGDEWNQLDTRVLDENENSYSFEAETGGNSIFATTILEREASIQVTDIDAEVNGSEQELPVERNISVKVQNRGLGNGSKQVNISADGEVIHTETVELEGKSDTRITTTHEFDSGSVDISAGSISNTVSIQSTETGEEGLPIVPAAVVLLALIIVAGAVYKKEQVTDLVESAMTGTEAREVEEDDVEFQGFEDESEEELTCDLCGQTFDSVRGLETHHGEVHDDHVFECEECGDEFDTRRGLHIHQGEVHGKEEVEVVDGYECGICEKVFDSERGLHIHHGQVHDDEKYRCSQCGKQFDSREELHNHQKKH